VIAAVLSKKQTIDQRDVQTHLYYSYLSTSSARRQPVITPHDIIISLDKSKTKFVRHSDKFRAKLESELASSKCEVVWAVDDDDRGTLTLRPSCTGDEDELARNWTDKCQSVAEQHVASVHRVEEKVCAEIWPRFLQETSSAAQSELSELYVEQDDNNCSLTCVGLDDVTARSFQPLLPHRKIWESSRWWRNDMRSLRRWPSVLSGFRRYEKPRQMIGSL